MNWELNLGQYTTSEGLLSAKELNRWPADIPLFVRLTGEIRGIYWQIIDSATTILARIGFYGR